MNGDDRVGVNFRAVRARGLAADRMFRCGAVTTYTARDATALRDRYGIRALVDLRSRREIDKYGAPKALQDAGIRWINAPVTGYPSTPIDKPRPTSDDVVAYYHGMLADALPESWPDLFAALASVAHEPFLVCCHCGKDRTGVVVAAVLDTVGSPAADIAEDYGASAADLVARVDLFEDKWSKRGHTRDDYLTRMRVVPATMADFLAGVPGGLAGFVARRVDPADLAAVRAALAAP